MQQTHPFPCEGKILAPETDCFRCPFGVGKERNMRIKEADVCMNAEKAPILIQKNGVNYPDVSRLNTVEKVVKVMTEVFRIDEALAETVYIVAMDTKTKPLNFFCVNKGTVNSSLIDVRGIMIRLLLSNASSFVLVHNHVSGEPQPSDDDESVTKRIVEAANLIGITLCDHIIIGQQQKFYSFRQMQPEIIL